MKKFKCSICGSKNLYQRRTEIVAQRLYSTKNDFDFGKEEVIDTTSSRLECGNDHPLLLKDGTECDTFKDYVKWQAEQV